MENSEKVGVASFSVCGLGNVYGQAITFGTNVATPSRSTMEADYTGDC